MARARLGIIAAVLAVALCPILSACGTLGIGSKGRTALVLVYNIHAGKDAKGVDNLERLAALFRSVRPDIVLLQEVDRRTTRSGNVDQPAELARLTGLNFAFGKSLNYQGGDYGIAVMSRWPIVGDSVIPLPVSPPQERSGVYEPRVALRAVVDAPGGRIAVINTHIDASRDDKWRRQEIVSVIAAAKRSAELAPTVLLGGDLNSTPESAVQAAVRSAGFVDSWQKCGKGDGLSFPADSSIKRIDYLYLDTTSSCDEASVLRTEASDHRPVLIRVRLRGS